MSLTRRDSSCVPSGYEVHRYRSKSGIDKSILSITDCTCQWCRKTAKNFLFFLQKNEEITRASKARRFASFSSHERNKEWSPTPSSAWKGRHCDSWIGYCIIRIGVQAKATAEANTPATLSERERKRAIKRNKIPITTQQNHQNTHIIHSFRTGYYIYHRYYLNQSSSDHKKRFFHRVPCNSRLILSLYCKYQSSINGTPFRETEYLTGHSLCIH